MKPKIEDVLFLDKDCEHDIKLENKVFYQKDSDEIDGTCPQVKISSELLENVIIDELKDKYYPGFVKYFKINSKDCTLKAEKNAQKSVEARVKGNALFAKRQHNADVHREIWELYSKSIALAPNRSKELVLAYECRSNLLLHFKKYEDCIKDIDRALAATEFDLLKVKLMCRKMTCFVAINKNIDEKEELWKIIKHPLEKINGAFKDEKFTKMIEQAKNDVQIQPANETKDEKHFSSLTSFPNAALSLNNDSHIIATRDFGSGEAVIVTKPTITSVNPDNFYAYCSYCLTFMWAGVPCEECALCMYCSDECKEKAWNNYHSLECKVNPHIDIQHHIHYDLLVSIKIFLMGVKECGSIAKLLEKIRKVEEFENDPNVTKSEADELLDSEFLKFYTLSNKVFADMCFLSTLAKNTCFLMAYLTQILGHIFEKEVGFMKGKELAKDENFVRSAVVMMKILMSCERYVKNSSQNKYRECPKHEERDECVFERCCPVGSVLHYFRGFIKNSCNPNVSICQTPDGKIIYYSTQPIKKMEEITIAQTAPFYRCDMIERHTMKRCKPSVHEFCRCEACVKEWPPLIQEFKKSRAKFMRRSSKVQTKGTELMEKYITKMRGIDDPDDYFKFDADTIHELARDTDAVVETCGQPSFASSWMIVTLCMAFKILHGDTSMQSHIPETC